MEGRGCRSERERGFAEGKAGEEKSDDEEERKAEKGDKREESSEVGVWGGTFTGHLEFAAPTTTDGIRAPLPARPRFRPLPLSPFDRGSGPVSPRLEAPTVHPRAAN